jgi:hypothetical protein
MIVVPDKPERWPMMHRVAAAALSLAFLSTALGGCGDDTGESATTERTAAASPTATPGTRPTSASPSVSASAADSGSTTAEPSPVDATTEPSPVDATTEPSPVDVEVAPETLAGYRVLSDAMNGFYAKAFRVARRHPHASPKNADEIKALVNYKFPEGVDLVEYVDPEVDSGASAGRMCFLGPADTHLVLGNVEDKLQQMLGTGGCRYDDGDVIVELSFDFADDDQLSVVWSANVVKGANLAAQIPGLTDFLDVLNGST